MDRRLKQLRETWNLLEGSWGVGPLDGDGPSDQKWDIAEKAIEGLDKQMKDKSNPQSMYNAVGLWLDLEERLETQYSYFKDDVKSEHHKLAREAIEWLLDNPDELIDQYNEPKQAEKEIKKILANIKELQKGLSDG